MLFDSVYLRQLDEAIRADLITLQDHYFSWVLASAYLVGLGVVLEGPEVLHETIGAFRNGHDGKSPRWIVVCGLLGWLLVAVGVAGEGVFDQLNSKAEGELQLFNDVLLSQTDRATTTARAEAEAARDAAIVAREQADATISALRVQELVTRADADDAAAFDELLSLRNVRGPSSRSVDAAIAERYRHVDDKDTHVGNWRKCLEPKSRAVYSMLFATNLEERKQGIANCGGWVDYPSSVVPEMKQPLIEIQSEVAPLLVRIAETDSSLFMRKEAILSLNAMFSGIPQFRKEGLDPLDKSDLERWWSGNGAQQRYLLLLADMSRPRQTNFGDVEMFFEAKKAFIRAPAALKPYLGAQIERMEYYARKGNEQAASEVARHFTALTCSNLRGHLSPAMGTEPFAMPSVEDLQTLKLCPADRTLLPFISNFASRTNFLFLRYGATEVLNAWQHTALDPFDLQR